VVVGISLTITNLTKRWISGNANNGMVLKIPISSDSNLMYDRSITDFEPIYLIDCLSNWYIEQ